MLHHLVFFLLLLCIPSGILADSKVYRSDVIQTSFTPINEYNIVTNNASILYSEYLFKVIANGDIYRYDGGHFKIQFIAKSTANETFAGYTDCITVGLDSDSVKKILDETIVFNQNGTIVYLKQITSTSVKHYGNGREDSNFTTSYAIISKAAKLRSFFMSVSLSGCKPIRTVSNWNDSYNWLDGVVPTSSDEVTFPQGVGVVVLTNNVTVTSFTMNDGLIIAQYESCPDGWSLSPLGNSLTKCYRLYEEPLEYDQAESVCRGIAYGLGTLIVQIEDTFESNVVKRVCRGSKTSSAFREGCWIGLRDAFGNGYYDWRDPSYMNDKSYRDFRRGSDMSDRQNLAAPTAFINNGDNCMSVLPWQDDPLIEEQGSWDEISCTSKRSFCVSIVGCGREICPHRRE